MNCYHCHYSDHLLCNTNPHHYLNNRHVCSHRNNHNHNHHDHDHGDHGDPSGDSDDGDPRGDSDDGDPSDGLREDSSSDFHPMNDCTRKCHYIVCHSSNYMDGDDKSDDGGDKSSNRNHL